MLTSHNGRRTTDKRRSQKLTMSTLCSEKRKTLLLQAREAVLHTFVDESHGALEYTRITSINEIDPDVVVEVVVVTGTIIKLIQDVIKTNVLTKFHEDKCDFIRKMPCFLAAMFFNQPEPFAKIVQHIIWTNPSTKFHEDLTINMWPLMKTAPPPPSLVGHVFQVTGNPPLECSKKIIKYKCSKKIIKYKFCDQTITVASPVLTRKNAPPPPPAAMFRTIT
ncbi:hypothetical protein DPMN_006548 [Dreissena polymorpha]|uniref:Uncharacterized protein n=1 Tax=Dreissena polymorpha TaxID=45954 RepID=A0A9D4MU79_DREPO|nr:hypothetical protein DPMN_006548 [Dreissena polymorpha]